MANTIVLTTSHNSDHTTLVVTDGTSYVNPIRSAASVSLLIYKIDFRGNEIPITNTPDTSNPLTVSTWTIPFSLDGQYRYKYYLSGVLTYTEDIVVYTLTSDSRDRQALSASLEQDMDANRNKDVNAFRMLDVCVEAMKAANTFSEYNKGERIARSAQGLL